MKKITLDHLKPFERVSQNIVRILGQNPGYFTMQGTNTYLIGNGSCRVLVDAGPADNGAYLEVFSEALLKYGVEKISHILLTHHHHDHAGGIPALLRSPFCQNIKTETILSSEPLSADKYPEKPVENTCSEILMEKFDFLNDRVFLEYSSTSTISKTKTLIHENSTTILLNGDTTAGFQKIQDSSVLNVYEGIKIIAIKTPGHTQDHMSYMIHPDNVLISGDCILGQNFPPVFENLSEYLKSLHRLIDQVCDENTQILPGHGPPVKSALEGLEALINHRRKKHLLIYNAIKNSLYDLNIDQLFEITYGLRAKYTGKLKLAAMHTLNQHVQLLVDDGIVSEKLICNDKNEHIKIYRAIVLEESGIFDKF